MCARGIHHSSKQSVISGLIQNHECVLNTTGQASCRKTPAMPGGWQEQRCRQGRGRLYVTAVASAGGVRPVSSL